MKRYRAQFYAFFFERIQHRLGKVQPCRRACSRAYVFCVHGLVTLCIFFGIVSFYIRRKRNMTVALKPCFIQHKVLFFVCKAVCSVWRRTMPLRHRLGSRKRRLRLFKKKGSKSAVLPLRAACYCTDRSVGKHKSVPYPLFFCLFNHSAPQTLLPAVRLTAGTAGALLSRAAIRSGHLSVFGIYFIEQ